MLVHHLVRIRRHRWCGKILTGAKNSLNELKIFKVSRNFILKWLHRLNYFIVIEEFEDIPSSESDDHRLSDDALAKEQQSISHNGLRHAIGNRVTCDENVRSDAMHLKQNAIRPTPRMTVNESSNPIVIQFHGPPKVTKQPKRHRRTRMVKELENNKCPRVQAGKGQREYPEIEVTDLRIIFSTRKWIIFNCRCPIRKDCMYV